MDSTDQSTSNACSNFMFFRVNQQKTGINVRLGCCFRSHLHLHSRNGDTCDAGTILFRYTLLPPKPQPMSRIREPVLIFASCARCSMSWIRAVSLDSSPRIQ